MAENSKIEWTNSTFNPWLGCTKVSPACKYCYAERDMDHRYKKVAWGPNGTRVLTSDDNWKKPIKWNREAFGEAIKSDRVAGRPRVFCASLADVFEDWKGPIVDHHGGRLRVSPVGAWVSAGPLGAETDMQRMSDDFRDVTMDDIRARLFRLIDATPNLDWLLLTKRPENIRAKWHPFDWQTPSDVPHRKNVWLGTSVESSEYLHRIDSLKAAGGLADVLFISAEPVVGPMPTLGEHLGGIDWVIAGGESGPEARPSHPDWFRSIRDQCEMHNVPFHFKQWGEWLPMSQGGTNGAMHEWESGEYGECSICVGKKAAGRILDGLLHDEYPLANAPTVSE